MNLLISSYWSDIKDRKDDYKQLIEKLCSKAVKVESSDLFLYSFGCHLKEFLDGYTAKMKESSKYSMLSKIKSSLYEKIRKKVPVRIRFQHLVI